MCLLTNVARSYSIIAAHANYTPYMVAKRLSIITMCTSRGVNGEHWWFPVSNTRDISLRIEGVEKESFLVGLEKDMLFPHLEAYT